jgi:hypothetical protein
MLPPTPSFAIHNYLLQYAMQHSHNSFICLKNPSIARRITKPMFSFKSETKGHPEQRKELLRIQRNKMAMK